MNYNIPKKNKLDLRAFVGHLVRYDSTNIFRVWVPSKNSVIRTRNVVFDPDSKYNPTELDTAVGLSEEVDNIVSILQIPQDSVPEPQEEDTELESITVEIPTGFGYQCAVSASTPIYSVLTID